jgi:hypothetical protein
VTKKTLNCLLVTLVLLLGMTSNGWTQASDAGTGGKPHTERNITEPQTHEAARELLSQLDD